MFAKLSFIAALVIVPFARGLFLQIPVDWKSSSQVNVSWSSNSTDSIFALQLDNTDEFHDTFSIADNLIPSANFASFQLGVVPQGSYTLRAINVTDGNIIYDQTPAFTIQGPPSSSVGPSSSSGTVSASSQSSVTASSGGSATVTAPAASNTNTGFGVTVSGSSTTAAAASSNSASGSGSGSSSATSSVPSSFNGSGNGAASLPRLAPWAAVALALVAGAAAAF